MSTSHHETGICDALNSQLMRSGKETARFLAQIGLTDEDIGRLADNASSRSVRRWRGNAVTSPPADRENKLRRSAAVADYILKTCSVEPPTTLGRFLTLPQVDPQTHELVSGIDNIVSGNIALVIAQAQKIFPSK